MAWLDNIRNAMHPYDDTYIENEERAAEEEFAQDEYEPEPEPQQPERPVRRDKHESRQTPPSPQSQRKKMKLNFIRPKSYDEARDIGDALKAGQAILINLEDADSSTALRILDFLSGAAYALSGRIVRVSDMAYIIATTNIDLVGDDLSEFDSMGLYF